MKTVVVTGTTSGIGYETARGVVRRGDHLIAINRSPSKWEQCCMRLKQDFPHAKISSFVADLASMQQIQRVCAEVIETHPIIDILINNAGIYLAQKYPKMVGKRHSPSTTWHMSQYVNGSWMR